MKPPSRVTVPFLAALCLLPGSPATTSAQTGAGDSNMWDVPRSGGETITEPSPDAAAMRRYQDYPVSYATGTADIAMSEYTGAKIKAARCKLNRLPVVEKWVYRNGTGADSLLRRYEYGRFRCGTDTLTRPTRVYITTCDAEEQSRHTIYDRHYRAYDSRGRITAMTDADGRRISATWDSEYDLLTGMTLDDAGLTTTYTYTPLVGCTSITAPSGKKRQFKYHAGRLTGEKNTAGKPVASYSYELYGESTDGATGRNLFTKTVHDDQGDATEAVLYDGFGMPVRTLSTVAGEGTVCSATTYDALDRPVRQYLPVPATTIDDTPETSSHYHDRYAYKTYTYRHLASDKPLSVISEGELLQEHPAKFEYLCNSATEPLLRCFRYTLSLSPEEETVTSEGYYPAGQLDITKATDPDGCTMLTFTDWRGFKVLERRIVDEPKRIVADTYFLYDVMGRLRVTIQPEGSTMMMGKSWSKWDNSDDPISLYAFIYRYDRRGNCVYSRVPGGGAERTYYDVYNRPAMHTTATLDEEGKTEVFLYDRIGRNALQCIVDVSFDTMIPDGFPKMTVRLDLSSEGIGGTGYVADENNIQSILDTRNLIVTTANYYDSYDILSKEEFAGIPGVENIDRESKTALRQLTARRQAVYGADENRTSFAESDTRYSVYSYNVEEHLTATYDNLPAAKISTAKTIEYTRLGRPTLETTVVSTTGYPHTLEMATGYDASGAVRSMTATLDGDTISSSALYSYNSLGQLAKAEYDNKAVIYSYELDGKLSSLQSAVFSQSLYYETYPKPCYNGNVSYMRTDYSMMADGIEVEYTYDKLNRLVSTFSTDNQVATYTYNLNSSPLTITRHGVTSDGYSIGLVDDLTLSYSGNRLQRVPDSADPVLLEASSDFDAPEGEATYRYDTSGRMIQDTGRGIQNTVYAPNDRPLLFDMGDNASRISYSYMSDGTRLSRTGTIRTSVRESYRTIWYIGAFRLMTSSGRSRPMLDRVELPWGYFDYQGKAFVYIRDCQQNVRSVVDSDGKFVQQTDYYPYGAPMATLTEASRNPYKYSGKEHETRMGLNQYDFHARNLLPTLGLFDQPDPKASDYPWLNPYLYCAANPIAKSTPLARIICYIWI